MSPAIVRSDSPVTLLGGARPGEGDLEAALDLAPRLVAADSGGATALARGYCPEAVIGDMDSLPDWAAARLEGRLHPIDEQETTDFDKALRSIEAPLIVTVGVSGGRFDHELAAMNVLVRQPARRCLVLGPESLVFLLPPRLELDLASGTDLALFPMAPCRIRSEGLLWPTEGLDFAPDGRIGTSNAAEGRVVLEPEAPRMLAILPRSTLEVCARALADSESRWDR